MYCKIVILITMMTCLLVHMSNSVPEKPEWPSKCKGKSYCPFKPKNYPQKEVDNVVQNTPLDFQQYMGMTNRSGYDKDVGDCQSFKLFKRLYLIKDQNDVDRYVAQSQNFTVMIQIEECRNPGRLTRTRFLDSSRIEQDEVHCHETRLSLELPVLSLDGRSLESATLNGGISVSCSTKLMRFTGRQYE